MTNGWTAKGVADALVNAFLSETNVANFFEIELTAEPDDKGFYRRADLLSIFTGGANAKNPFVTKRPDADHPDAKLSRLPPGWRVGFEIKCSRGDFLTDVKDRLKQMPLSRITHEIYFVCPREVSVDPDELPYGAGLIEVWGDDRTRWLGAPRAAITRPSRINWHPETPPWFFNLIASKTCYGKPSGGLYALEIYRADTYEQVQAVKRLALAEEGRLLR